MMLERRYKSEFLFNYACSKDWLELIEITIVNPRCNLKHTQMMIHFATVILNVLGWHVAQK
jgi:hypothetical protein